ncbi:hypothetical protein MKX01_028356, partial [Papaver californicum]
MGFSGCVQRTKMGCVSVIVNVWLIARREFGWFRLPICVPEFLIEMQSPICVPSSPTGSDFSDSSHPFIFSSPPHVYRPVPRDVGGVLPIPEKSSNNSLQTSLNLYLSLPGKVIDSSSSDVENQNQNHH